MPRISHYACHYPNRSQSITFSGQWVHWFCCSQPVNCIMIGRCVAPPSGPTVHIYTVLMTRELVMILNFMILYTTMHWARCISIDMCKAKARGSVKEYILLQIKSLWFLKKWSYAIFSIFFESINKYWCVATISSGNLFWRRRIASSNAQYRHFALCFSCYTSSNHHCIFKLKITSIYFRP